MGLLQRFKAILDRTQKLTALKVALEDAKSKNDTTAIAILETYIQLVETGGDTE